MIRHTDPWPVKFVKGFFKIIAEIIIGGVYAFGMIVLTVIALLIAYGIIGWFVRHM